MKEQKEIEKMGKEIRKAYAISSKYLTKNDEIETYYRCSECNMSISKEQNIVASVIE